MKGYVVLAIVLSLLLPFSRSATAQVTDFQGSVQIVTMDFGAIMFLYPKANGDVYLRFKMSESWTEPPTYLGNFFEGLSVPSDFLEGLRVIIVNPGVVKLLYASPTGAVLEQIAYPLYGTWNSPPGLFGNFFPGGSALPDFQQGFHVVREAGFETYIYVSPGGDVYTQDFRGNWSQPPNYVGNFFGEHPVPSSQSTFGSIKALYRAQGGKP